jgi:hypothetical protein
MRSVANEAIAAVFKRNVPVRGMGSFLGGAGTTLSYKIRIGPRPGEIKPYNHIG